MNVIYNTRNISNTIFNATVGSTDGATFNVIKDTNCSGVAALLHDKAWTSPLIYFEFVN